MDIVQVVTAFVFGLGVIAPFFLKSRAILKEVKELIVVLSQSLDDGDISLDEVKLIIREAKDVIVAVKK